MTTLAVYRTKDGLPASADLAQIQVTSSSGSIVIPTVTVLPIEVGTYRYATSPLLAGRYTAVWTFTVATLPTDTVVQPFTVELPEVTSRGIKLAQIERAVAARLGPFRRLMSAPTGSTTNALAVSALISSIDQGEYEDLYLLRRGRYQDNTLVTGFVTDDRTRLVSQFNASTGTLVPDRAWSQVPISQEMVELHYLHPDDELRPSVLAGLRRCYFEDTLELASAQSSGVGPINLTALSPWITRPQQIRDVGLSVLQMSVWGHGPTQAPWYRAYRRGPAVYLHVPRWPTTGITLTALRPASSLVNGEDSLIGPNDDDDVLDIDLIYATRAGHVSAWELFTPRLSPVAAQGLALPMKQVSDAFTLASATYCPGPIDRIHIDWPGGPYGYGALDEQVGNLGGW